MTGELSFSVTLMRAGPGLPYFERGYRYVSPLLPAVGDLITIDRVSGSDEEATEPTLVYVTRVDPDADSPIRVTEAKGVTLAASTDDFIVAA